MRDVILSYLTTSFLPLRLMTWMSSSSSETRDWSLDRFAGLCGFDSELRGVCRAWVRPLVVVRVAGTAAAAGPRRPRAAAAGRRQLRVSESRRAPARVLSSVRAVLRGPRGCECVGGRRRQRGWAARPPGAPARAVSAHFKPSPLLAETAR